MTKVVPYKKDFDLVSKVEKISNIILWSSVTFSIVTIIISYSEIQQSTAENLTSILNAVNCFLAVAYFLSDIISNYLFQLAEAKRRDDFFDNSLNTNLSEENSNKYFTNDDTNTGIRKLGVNCFENSFFTKSIATKMLLPMIIKSIVVFILFLILAISNNHLFTAALQIALPYTIIQQTIRLFVFRNRVENVCKGFQRIFSTNNKKTIEQAIIHNVTSYETTLAWGCIKLDSNLFNQMNDELSEKWNKIKAKYNIS
ncbi:MAG: hypothetical protein V9F02_12760 [Chitinophagaceae bacterium]|jgi:hypothetical protein|nr:MAG: hypothetical protein E6Q89_00020 [Bacteroidia bacterium]